MFAPRFFARRYYPGRYFPPVVDGGAPPGGTGGDYIPVFRRRRR